MLGPDAERDGRSGARRGRQRQRQHDARVAEAGEFDRLAAVGHLAGEEVHGRRADEAGDEDRGRPVVDVHRRADLVGDAGVHDDQPVGQGHRLDLVVGDVDRGDAELALQALDLERASARAAWRRGWRAARRTGTPPARARWRGPWRRAGAGRPRAGAAGAASNGPSSRILAAFCTRTSISALATAADLQAKGHVLVDAHVRIERVVLEHHGDVAILGLAAR